MINNERRRATFAQPVARVRLHFYNLHTIIQSIISIYGSMSRAAIKYQSYFISLRTNRARARTFYFWRINFSPPPLPPSLAFPIPPLLIVLSSLLSRFVLLSSRVSFLAIYIWLCGSMVPGRNKVSIIPHLSDQPATGCCTPQRGAQVCVPSGEYEECGSPVTHFPNSRIVLHPRARTK